MKRRMRETVVAVFLLLTFAGSLAATQMVLVTPREMAEQSALVLSGEVTAVESYWNEGRTKIFTRMTLKVDETYKGVHSRYVEVIQLGGTVGNVKVSVEGALQWRTGEEVLLFLESYGQTPQYQVAGLIQGRYDIERDPETGERYVRRPAFQGVELMGEDGAPSASDGALEKVRLERFVSEVIEER